MNITKKQKYITKDESPRLEGVQHAAQEKWKAITNSCRKNEAAGSKWKHSVVDVC